MNRAGREPTEDVKRRLVAACREAGLHVTSARMYLRASHRDRIVVVAASPPDESEERPAVMLLTTVGTSGDFSGTVDIRCSTAEEDDPITRFWDLPVMQGRNMVRLEDLPAELAATLRERDEVRAALRLGVAGPYTFERTSWQKPSDLLYT